MSCKTGSLDRRYHDIKEEEAIELYTWKDWVVVSYPDSKHAIIRNQSRAIMISRPKWMSDLWIEGDTIK